jgi:hypothetical protein
MKNKSRFSLLFTLLFIVACTTSTQLFGQSCANAPTEYYILNVNYDTFKVYPSMAPRSYIKVSYKSFPEDAPYSFDETNLTDYVIVKDGAAATEQLKLERMEDFKDIHYLVFDAKSNGLKKGDKINVGLCATKKINGQSQRVLIWNTLDPNGEKRAETLVPEIDNYTVELTPGVVPDQELVDGSKSTVGQLKFKLDVPSLIRNDNVARFYFNSDNTVSTNWKDKNSKLEMRLGAERSLTSKWYVPVNFETKLNGDQRINNATFVALAGIKSILPWAWTKRGLFNSLVRAPVSPEFGLSAEFHRRLKQDAPSLAKFPSKNSFALASEFTWLPIQLFTKSCKVKDKDGNYTGEEDFDQCFSAQNISIELSAKGWWFPYEKTITGTKVRRFEGRFEVSLLLPVRNIAKQFLFKKKDDEAGDATQRIRIKYVTGANDANGFKRSSQIVLGFEVIK